ncbi:MAG TPA: hypothetical protein VFF06_13370 [Polyangia bacterium]|nr:hypothetical protein [Polyangia bacterium]
MISKYEDEIRRVQCNPCGDVHGYRKPKGEADEETPEPAPKKKAAKAKPTWDQVMAKSKKQPRNYAIDEYFKEMEIVAHPKFGVGYVTENIGDDKIEVTFKENGKEEKRVLVHNRKGLTLPVSMLRPLALPNLKVGKAGKGQKPAVVAPPTKGAARPASKKPAAPPKAKAKGAARPAAKKPAAKPAVRKAAAKVKVKAKAKAAAKKHPPAKKPVKKVKKSR